MERVVVDTGVFIDYIVENSPTHDKAVNIIEGGTYEIYVNPITLSEVFYISYRIYREAGEQEPEILSYQLVKWITAKFRTAEINEELAILAGRLKANLHIALPDCFTIASAIHLGGIAVFKKEKEILNAIKGSELEKVVRFL